MTYEEAKMQIQAIPEKIWDQLSEPDREAMEMAFSALEKQIPKKPMISIDVTNENLWHLYCPTCGSWVGMHNKRLKGTDMHNNTNCEICAKCGQAFDLELEGE